ncbi:nucleotide sugar dehydrogenase [Leptospira yanagawae]|uniref:Nucleotide sugar dehydrogenase n=1 Tax=Leptospira yanagawae TaxID=293069 RepID=A0ABY2LX12_9LEPT|nr:nucleotide sugar dehydrogenase [Leptospira yanagawae]TGL16504.1 nucleotide sugar dehydrogenase [Leptospira yanagawae]
MKLSEKIVNKNVSVGIIGLGYVGLPLAIEFANRDINVIGFDLDIEKVDSINVNKSYLKHIPSERLINVKGKFTATSDFSILKEVDCIIICVPTPLNNYKEPDLSYVIHTAEMISKYIRKDQLVVLESTTYPGTTEEVVKPILEISGLKSGKDFYLAFSPEREDPANKHFSTSSIPKVVGGFTEGCLKAAQSLYSIIIKDVVTVSSTRVAESSKLLENIYRAVNIALVNELKLLFDRMNIDIYEVIDAAKTKPFGFQAFYPGPGLGGHCIPIDPFYLTWKAKEYDFSTRFIELAGEINTKMPYFVVQKVHNALNTVKKCVNGSKILILGLAYKKNVDDIRESPSLKLIKLLEDDGAIVDYNDPFVTLPTSGHGYDLKKKSIELSPENISQYDCILISADHDFYKEKTNYENLVKCSNLIVDTRNIISITDISTSKLFRA